MKDYQCGCDSNSKDYIEHTCREGHPMTTPTTPASPDSEREKLIERLIYAAYSWGFEVGKSGQTVDSTIAMNKMNERKKALLAATPAADVVKDAERLDWIARQGDEFSSRILVDCPGDGNYYVSGGYVSGEGETFRAAIDAAMLKEGK